MFFKSTWVMAGTILFAAGLAHGGDAFLVGGDISALPVIEAHGGVFRSGGVPGDAIEIMRGRGLNCFRLRLFVDPPHENVVVNDLEYTIALAKRVKAAGATLLLDFHYSDTWADPGKQTKPKAWEELPFPELETKVYEYTRDCLKRMCAAGAAPDLVQIGNEITPGMLWPDGKLWGVGEPEAQWDHFAGLLKAAARGVKAGMAASAPARIVIHIAKGGDWKGTKNFFEHIEARGVPYDVIGQSYYPWWHGTLEELRETTYNAARTFGKDVFIVETAYPYRAMPKKSKYKVDTMVYPETRGGQAAFVKAMTEVIRDTPGGRGLGVVWWYPESIEVEGLRMWHGGSTALFDETGEALPAMGAFAE